MGMVYMVKHPKHSALWVRKSNCFVNSQQTQNSLFKAICWKFMIKKDLHDEQFMHKVLSDYSASLNSKYPLQRIFLSFRMWVFFLSYWELWVMGCL